MATEVEFNDEDLRRFLERLAAATDKPEKIKPVVGAMSAIVFKDVIDHFKEESGPKEPWDPWSDIYAERMRKLGRGGNKILQWSGRLRQNFRPTKYKVAPHAVTWFNNATTRSGYPYAWGHDSGDGKLPQREFMWLSDKGLDQIGSVVWDEILREANG